MTQKKLQLEKCPECLRDKVIGADETKEKSDHRELVEFFHDMTLKTRGFKPRISPKDAKQLKNVLDLNILDRQDLEKMTLYFLADQSYKNLGPSIATMMSSTVLNSLVNKLRNRAQFYRELEGYAGRYMNRGKPVIVSGQTVDIAAKIEELKAKLSIK